MPLLDHFQPPLYPSRGWRSFLATWSTQIISGLNRSLPPPGYYAETQVHIGSRVEVDVATPERATDIPIRGNGPAVAVVEEVWAPIAPPLVLPAVFPDEIEVQVISTAAGIHLVAAIELISPGNKDRPETRRAFAAKCSSYLQAGVGLVIVDVVTDRRANLHDELMGLLAPEGAYGFATETSLYAVAYRPARRATGDQIDCWPSALAVGESLPTVPLALRGGPTLPLDLESTYMDARRDSRL